METIEKNNFSVTFPNYRLYLFDRNYIEVQHKGGQGYVKFSSSTDGNTYSEEREYSPSGIIRFDLFGLLFPLFDMQTQSPFTNEPCKIVTFTIDAGGEVHTAQLVVSYGLRFENTPEAVRVYSRHEFRLSLITGRQPTAAHREYFSQQSKPTYYTTSQALLARKPAQLDFEAAGVVTPLRLIWDDCSEGVCLRWLDVYGNIYFWVFEQGDITEKTTHTSESVPYIPKERALTETNAQHFSRGRSFIRETKLGALRVSRAEAEYLKTISSAVIIERFKGARVGAGMWAQAQLWEGVNISGQITIKKDVSLEDLEFVMQQEYNTIKI